MFRLAVRGTHEVPGYITAVLTDRAAVRGDGISAQAELDPGSSDETIRRQKLRVHLDLHL